MPSVVVSRNRDLSRAGILASLAEDRDHDARPILLHLDRRDEGVEAPASMSRVIV